MIEIKDLTKTYGEHKAIQGLNFSVQKGEVVGFLGPNGAGKSTTMKIITGYMAPTEGVARVAGYDVFENPIEVKKKIGYLPETPPLYMDMTVQDYLEYVAKLKQVSKENIATFISRSIDRTNLGDVRKRVIGHLSKGFKQRVGLAQALVSQPEVLILDEPTVGLDPMQVAEVRNLIRDLAGQHTIILSTHILSEVQAICGRVIIINRGSIVAQDTLQGLHNRLSGSHKVVLKVRRDAVALAQALKTISGVLSVSNTAGRLEVDTSGSDDVTEKIAVASVPFGLMEMSSMQTNLEDIFIKVTSGQTQFAGGVQ